MQQTDRADDDSTGLTSAEAERYAECLAELQRRCPTKTIEEIEAELQAEIAVEDAFSDAEILAELQRRYPIKTIEEIVAERQAEIDEEDDFASRRLIMNGRIYKLADPEGQRRMHRAVSDAAKHADNILALRARAESGKSVEHAQEQPALSAEITQLNADEAASLDKCRRTR